MANLGGPLHFDEIAVGNRWVSQARTVTESDVINFAGLTGDFTPLHVDYEFARKSPFGRPIAHGLLGLSIMAGLSSVCPLMQTVVFLGIREWRFVKPIFFGDTIHVETEVVAKEASGRRRGKVLWRRRVVNQHGEVVQEGELETLVAMRGKSSRRETVPAEGVPVAVESNGESIIHSTGAPQGMPAPPSMHLRPR